jgi:hypothetical protein
MGKKEKKQKIKYVDDGSTIADMSGLNGEHSSKDKPKKERAARPRQQLARSSGKEIFRTYIESVKLMFLPMLAVLGLLAVAFLLVYLML